MNAPDDLVERLERASHDERLSTGALYREAAARIREQEAEIARLNRAAELYTEAGSAATLQWEQRAERAEAERDQMRAVIEAAKAMRKASRCNDPECYMCVDAQAFDAALAQLERGTDDHRSDRR